MRKNTKNHTRARGAKTAPPQPTTALTVPPRETVERPGPDLEDLAIANADDPWADEPEVPERFRYSRLIPFPQAAVSSKRPEPDADDLAVVDGEATCVADVDDACIADFDDACLADVEYATWLELEDPIWPSHEDPTWPEADDRCPAEIDKPSASEPKLFRPRLRLIPG